MPPASERSVLATAHWLPLLGREHQPRDQRRRLLLHRRDGVRVGVEGDRDRGMPEALGDDLGVDARLQREGGVGVPLMPISA